MTTTVQWMSRYQARPRWELTVMLGRPAAIGLSYYHQRALCWNNEILHKNMFSWPFFHYSYIEFYFQNVVQEWQTEVVLCSFDLICMSFSSESHVKLEWDMQASLEPDKSLMSSASLFHISNGSAHILPDHTPDRSCIGRWNSLSGRGTKTWTS